jgi:glucan phosphoethanolaminetransferase (alkaline phosphatase superfamily)
VKRFLAPLLFLLAGMIVDLCFRYAFYAERIEYLYFRAGVAKTAGVYALSLAATLLTMSALFSLPRFGKWVLGFVTAFFFLGNMLFQATLGHFIGSPDIRIVENADQYAVTGAFSSYYRPEMIIFAPIALALWALAVWLGTKFPGPAKEWRFRGALCFAAFFGNLLLWDYLYIKCNDFPVEALTSTTRMAFYVEKEDREFLEVVRQRLEPIADLPAPKDNVVYIIDESVRSDYVSINRPDIGTTPFLAELAKQPGFMNYGVMIAATTCSFTTKALLFTGTPVAPDVERAAMKNPTIFQHAKRYGYKTIVLDGPGRNFPNIAIRETDLPAIDVLLRAREIPGKSEHADINAAEFIRNTTRESTGNFIVLIKVGAHFHYERCYPSAEEKYSKFLPKLSPGESYGSSREKTINSYKNALLFTVDTFFETMMAAPLPNTTVFWTSDHGQSLQEQGQTYTHCKDEIEQSMVPFVIISDLPWVADNAVRPEIPLSHHHLYPSLVSLFAKSRDVHHGDYASLFSAKVNSGQPPLFYYYGGIWASSRKIPVSREQWQQFK